MKFCFAIILLFKSYSLEYKLYKKSKISNEFSTTFKNASLPFFFKNSSGSLLPSNCKTLIEQNKKFTIKKDYTDINQEKIEKKEFKQANNLEMAIVKMLLRKPEYYNFFKEEKLESDIANKIFKFFNQKIKENLFFDSSIIMREFKNYIEESNDFSQYEKNNELARIIMDYVLIPNKTEEERENTELFKSYLREKLRLRDKTKDDIAKKIEFGKLKKEIAKTKSVEEFIKVYNSFKYLF